MHASYDLFAILVQSPPEPLDDGAKGCCGSLWETFFPKEINWDDEAHKNRGITAVAPVSSRYGTPDELAFNKDERMRNGPIASGNAHGDFYLHNLYERGDDGETQAARGSIRGPHVCFLAFRAGEELLPTHLEASRWRHQ